jgi:putative ABC transport system permease protein
MILLVGSGLALRSLLRVLEVRPGFNPENLLTMRISLSPGSRKAPQQMIAFQQELIRRLRSIPGTVNVATVTVLPLSGKGHPTLFSIQGRDKPAWNTPWTQCLSVDPGYFATMGVPLRAGRSFMEQDNEKAAKAAIVNETLARTYFPGENPIGKRIIVWRESPEPREIVGVSADIKNNGLDSAVWPETYVPFAQDPQPVMSVAVRTASDPAALIADARRVIRQLDRDTPVFDAMPMSNMIAASPGLVLRRMPSLLMSLVAAAALLLAAVGISSVMASMVGQRTQEIGIRIALGAERRNVLWMVLRQSLKLVLIGIAAGLPASFALTRLVTKWLFGVTPFDAATYVSVGMTLIGVALLSCYVPARRAAKVDPAMALRHE